MCEIVSHRDQKSLLKPCALPESSIPLQSSPNQRIPTPFKYGRWPMNCPRMTTLGKNVFYWFQNHKNGEKQKQKEKRVLSINQFVPPPFFHTSKKKWLNKPVKKVVEQTGWWAPLSRVSASPHFFDFETRAKYSLLNIVIRPQLMGLGLRIPAVYMASNKPLWSSVGGGRTF